MKKLLDFLPDILIITGYTILVSQNYVIAIGICCIFSAQTIAFMKDRSLKDV